MENEFMFTSKELFKNVNSYVNGDLVAKEVTSRLVASLKTKSYRKMIVYHESMSVCIDIPVLLNDIDYSEKETETSKVLLTDMNEFAENAIYSAKIVSKEENGVVIFTEFTPDVLIFHISISSYGSKHLDEVMKKFEKYKAN